MSYPNCALIGTIVLSALLAPLLSHAQIVPDTTLPANSAIAPDGNTAIITGGSRAGGNLFHSFREFSVLTGNTAYFNNASDIQNIITRVTGSSPSNIDGLVKANGSANLFLINPNGISFGENARLNIGGSFVASTANSLKFADGTEFSATNPSATPLLTVSVPIGLQFGGANSPAIASPTPGSISVTGFGHDGIAYDDKNDQPRVTLNNSDRGLSVQPGKTLALVGGSVSLDGAILQAPGGRVELSGIAGEGTVELNIQPSGEARLRFPDAVDRSDISLSNRALVDVAASGGGDIAINARNLNISGSSALRGGIKPENSTGSQAGNIEINATGRIALPDNSQIFNTVESGAIGNAGEIKITADSLSLANGAGLELSTYGQGDAGDVDINVRNTVSFDGKHSPEEPSGIATKVGQQATGKAGDIKITAGSLSVSNGAVIVALTEGQGDAGSLTINARDAVLFDGDFSEASSSVQSEAIGNAGNINITAGSLTVANGAQLYALTYGEGDAGSVIINARDAVSFEGGFASSSVQSEAIGNAGNINITAGSLTVANGAQLYALTYGEGDAGSVIINARDAVSFEGGFASSSVQSEAIGNAGNINITAGSLTVANGAQLYALTYGEGDAGSVIINARDAVSFEGGFASSSVQSEAIGNAGNINITAGSLTVANGAQLYALTYGEGDAGSVIINARDAVSFEGGFASSSVQSEAIGNAGNINITAGSLTVANGAQLYALTYGEGDAGSVIINARDAVSFEGGFASSSVQSEAIGNAGNINITAGSLTVANGAQLYALTRGEGDVGSVTVETGRLTVRNQSQINTSGLSSGNPGDINIVASDRLLLDNQGNLTAQSEIGTGGNIKLKSPNIQLRRQSQISAFGDLGREGNITINADTLVLLENSQIVTLSSDINGGSNIRISPLNSSRVAIFKSPESLIYSDGELFIEDIATVDPSDIPDVKVTSVEGQISPGCEAYESSSFVVTGRGGLPPNPNDPLASNAVVVEWARREVADSGMGHRASGMGTNNLANVREPIPNSQSSLVEATGWRVAASGEIILTAAAPAPTLQNPALIHPGCRFP